MKILIAKPIYNSTTGWWYCYWAAMTKDRRIYTAYAQSRTEKIATKRAKKEAIGFTK